MAVTRTTRRPTRRPTVGTRRTGYVIAAALNAVLLYLVNVWPGWQAVPFLTEDTRQVLGLVNLSLAASIAVNLVYLAYDPRWVRSLGDLLTTSIGLAGIVRVWQVFPFDVDGYSVDWALVIRGVLVVAGVGAAIGILVQLVALIRAYRDPRT